jgi:signal transduction histidine kinase
MLEGFDQDWTAASTRRAAYYTNLPPGRYRFRVATAQAAPPAAASEAFLSFVWEPRFHETGWFYGLCGLLAAASVWAGFRLYARQTVARYNALLGERARLAREMHDTVIQGCVGVSTLLEAASSLERSGAARWGDLLDQARTQVRLTLDEARQAVWDLRRGSFGGDLASTLPGLASSLSAEKGILVQTEIRGRPTTPLSERTDRNLLLVAREAMRNAAAHGSPKRIEVTLAFDADEVRLEVVDDGQGFAPPAVGFADTGHYGIEGMRERIAQLGGTFQLRSAPGKGASVIARVPLTRHVRNSQPAEGDHEQVR